jgi:hypothetical protein
LIKFGLWLIASALTFLRRPQTRSFSFKNH